jgi:predicted dehydrogenase
MSLTDSALPVAVVGVGRMGAHHARVYRQIPGATLVAVVDSDPQRAQAAAAEFGCDACTTTEQLLAQHPRLRAASVATPTATHVATARPLLERRIACLIEKPLAPTVAEAQALVALARSCGAILQVGHTERFNPAVQALTAMNLRPRFIEVDRISPMTFRSLDVGVVMDMMIHDLDIVLLLADSPLKRIDATGVAVLGPHEDVANARLLFASGCVANLTASRLALKTERKLRLFSEDAYVSLDYARRNGLVIRKSDNAQALDDVRRQLASGADLAQLDYSKLVQVKELTMDQPGAKDDPLTLQLTSFLASVRQGRSPAVDAFAGYAAVEAAERVIAAIQAHRWEGLEAARV